MFIKNQGYIKNGTIKYGEPFGYTGTIFTLNELIFSMKVWEAKFAVNVTDATIDRSAISKGWRWHEFTSDFGEKILIDNIKEVTYQREVIYRG